ncbi:MAG: glycine cleavage system protein T, partial [Candidatus Omnitrophica bacterium]|nr:glycine cleavage system protein T [Candidatus Omnitrophota bacterium]
ARDTLRLEMSYPLYGQDLTTDTTPLEAGKSKFVNMKKEFIGKAALLNKSKPARNLINFTADSRRAPRHNYRIFSGSKDVGIVTSGSFSPSLLCGIGMGYADPICVSGSRIMLKASDIEIPATVTEGPFYKKGTAKL